MNNQADVLNAYTKGLARLVELYKEDKFQSYISATPDMMSPVESPKTLFPELDKLPREIFTELVITDFAFKNKPQLKISSNIIANLKNYQNNEGVFTFCNDYSLFPADIDDTGIGLAILVETGNIELSVVHQIANRMLNNVDEKGVFRVYFPPYGHRIYIDPVVSVNGLYIFALLGREKEAQKTVNYVFEYLDTEAYLKGTRMYPSPDIFLCFLARLINKSSFFREIFESPIKQCLETRIGTSTVPLELAARVIAARSVGIHNEVEKQKLILSQSIDGEWPANTFFEFHRRHGYFGCEALTTAFAIKALETPFLYEQFLSHYSYVSSYQPYYDETLMGKTINISINSNSTTVKQASTLF